MLEGLRDVQRQLFQWRMDFFKAHFFSMFCGHDLPASNWITLGLDDSHIFDTLPYNVTQNFEEVMMLASTKKILDPNQHEHFYFSNDECASFKAFRRFEQQEEEDVADPDREEEEGGECGCEEATEEEKWEQQLNGMAMQWAMMSAVNLMQRALLEDDDIQNVSSKMFS